MTSLFYRFLSLKVWGNIPSMWQKQISRMYASMYNQPFTRHIIPLYCRWHRLDDEYLSQFQSESGRIKYNSFQDFFTRKYRKLPEVQSEYIWPCEGLLCDVGMVDTLPLINVKGELKQLRVIFGSYGSHIPCDYCFTNVFLHNNNYHRIHAPVKGRITSVERLKGDLVLLRPWVYGQEPSLPAMRNERVNIILTDTSNRPWFISIVGGPAVGTIQLADCIVKGSQLHIGQEIGKFLLGSTCCMASPVHTQTPLGKAVEVGNSY